MSLIDIFTILIFFLLSNAGGVETPASRKAVKLPESTADKAPKETMVVVVNRHRDHRRRPQGGRRRRRDRTSTAT